MLHVACDPDKSSALLSWEPPKLQPRSMDHNSAQHARDQCESCHGIDEITGAMTVENKTCTWTSAIPSFLINYAAFLSNLRCCCCCHLTRSLNASIMYDPSMFPLKFLSTWIWTGEAGYIAADLLCRPEYIVWYDSPSSANPWGSIKANLRAAMAWASARGFDACARGCQNRVPYQLS